MTMRAIEWVRDHTCPSTTGTPLVPQDAYDAIADEALRDEVDHLIGEFRVPDRGEYAYARVLPGWDEPAS